MLEDRQIIQNNQKDNLKIKVSIILLLFVTLIVISVIIILDNYFYIMNQSNIHIDKEIPTEYNSYGEEMQYQENIKRILVDTQINTWIPNDQMNPTVSTLSDGKFVVVWQSYLHDNNIGYSIYGQIFYSNGAKRGNEFHISDFTALNQTNPNVTAASNGKFMVI